MSFFFKTLWFIRAFLYQIVFGRFSMPGYIGAPIFLFGIKRIFIDRYVRIFPGVRIECHGQGRLFIHRNVSIGQGFHVTCMGDLHIREGVLITGYVTVTDIEHEYEVIDLPVLSQPMVYKKTEIGENSFIGMGARIQAGTILGKGCVVGANAVVRGIFPDYSVIVGAPGRVIKRYNPETSSWERVCDPDKHSQCR